METTPRSEDEREALVADAREVAASVIADATNYPLPVVPHVLSRDMGGLIAAVAEAFIAAGYREQGASVWEYRTTVGGYDPQPHGRLNRGDATEAEVLAMLADDPRPLVLERRLAAGPWVPVGEGEQRGDVSR